MKRLIFIFTTLLFPGLDAAESPRSGKIEFNRDVRPILSENCFACHGFDPKHREADLRLDTFEGATEDRDGSRGIVPGDPAKSDVWKRITSDRSRRGDAAAEVAQARADRSPARDPESLDRAGGGLRASLGLRAAEAARRCRTWRARNIRSIASFRRGWRRKSFAPSPPADAATLIRRVSLDLTGLPPTPAEVDALWRPRPRTRTRPIANWWTACCAARTTASAGAAGGSIRPATPTATATRSTRRGRFGNSATG